MIKPQSKDELICLHTHEHGEAHALTFPACRSIPKQPSWPISINFASRITFPWAHPVLVHAQTRTHTSTAFFWDFVHTRFSPRFIQQCNSTQPNLGNKAGRRETPVSLPQCYKSTFPTLHQRQKKSSAYTLVKAHKSFLCHSLGLTWYYFSRGNT